MLLAVWNRLNRVSKGGEHPHCDILRLFNQGRGQYPARDVALFTIRITDQKGVGR